MSATSIANPSPAWLDEPTLAAVRPQVRALLEQSEGFRGLPSVQQREIATNMVRVASFMANPQGLAKQEFDAPVLNKSPSPPALALDAVDDAKAKASGKIGTFAGADFKAGALHQGTEEFKNLVGTVDFPKFVGGLIQNVFQAIVSSSIQQMKAYGDMLKSVAQTVDQFAQDNISMDSARGWLADKYPDKLEMAASEEEGQTGSRLRPKGEDGDANLAAINHEMQILKPISDLSDEEQESRLVMAARMQMARSRQQLLASMVLLGINRIVITDGAINAKVVFDFRASDEAKRKARAGLSDKTRMENQNTTAVGGGFLGWGAASMNQNDYEHTTTVSSSVDETSESKAELKAKLTGEVRVNFKSDYFPMEKLATPGMLASIQGNALPYDPNPPRPATPSAPAVGAPPAAPAGAAVARQNA
jgi:hypothetical protein